MISYRHHIVSLVAVFLALAVGVVLGGGPLSDLGRDDSPASATTKQHRAAAQDASYGDTFATATADRLYAGKLAGTSVSILTLPGADGDEVSALASQVEAAGGRVASTYAAQPALVEASQKSLVDTLGSQLMTQLGSGAVTKDAPTYDRIGQLVGLGIAGDEVPMSDAQSVRQSLDGAELMTAPDGASRGSLVLVVLGDDVDPAILSGILSGLADKATGVVVAGNTASATAKGSLTALREEPAAEQVATVDGADTALGQVTTVLALIRSQTAPGGSFGASGSDGAVPLK
ncbi:copper transporter [Nocardioides mangrovi]|uniref:Copper transporter n=1 Tax=Nocardioides mangrovi TaxID=2874580 RepID=A0ABS7UJ97_9ACTN|nr:copper transporter [Nocardioides mangrovi]MBZ5740736.1 copper transporter [Nocardioides mangrovi]